MNDNIIKDLTTKLLNKQSILMLKGLPASGKSTLAKSIVDNGKGKIVRINKDDLRAMVHNSKHSKAREKLIIEARDTLINLFISQGKSVIIDDTNFNPIHKENLSSIANEYELDFIEYFVDTPIRECLRRNALRDNPVPDYVIAKMYFKYIDNKDKYKDYDTFYSNRNCYIVDIDGTLAIHDGRDPYAFDDLGSDIPNIPLYNLLQNDTNIEIIFVSGREKGKNDVYYNSTRKWIYDNFHIPESDITLFMREYKDSRKDSIVKKEIYEKYIKDNYKVLIVFDDRNQTVDMWRGLGLQCLQVNYGDF